MTACVRNFRRNMMKKKICILLVLLMSFAFVLTACNESDPPENQEDYYSVIYVDGVDGEEIAVPTDNNKYSSGDTVTVKDGIERTGYDFIGWKTGSTVYKPGDTFTMAESDVTLTAQWDKKQDGAKETYTVTYSLGECGGVPYGGTSTPPTEPKMAEGDEFKLADAPEWDGYNFLGWSDGTATKPAGTMYKMPGKSVTLTAQWEKKQDSVKETYSVKYSLGECGGVPYGGTSTPPPESKKAEGDEFKLADAPEWDNYKFCGWSDGQKTQSAGTMYKMPGKSVTLTALWEGPLKTYYNIKFYDYDGITLLSTVSVEEGAQIEYDGDTPTRTETAQYTYAFVGWSATLGGEAEDLPTATGNADYFAVYTSTLRSYKITFTDGQTELGSVTVSYGTRPEYDGTVADKAMTEMLVDRLCGWEDEDGTYALDNLPTVSGEKTYNAVFAVALKAERGTEASPYVITDELDLEYIADSAADGNTFENVYFELGSAVTAENVKPIGTADTPFAGRFDGKNYTVTYSQTQTGAAGLFGYLSGEVKDLNVAATVRGAVVGGIAAYNSGNVIGCSSSGKLYGTQTVGGTVGDNSGVVEYASSSALVYLNNRLSMTDMVGSNAGVLVGKSTGSGSVKLADAVWSGDSADGFSSGDGSEDEPYVISSGEELAFLSDSVKGGTYYGGKYFILSADIDLNNIAWTGIGVAAGTNPSATNCFAGILNGNGHTIYNISITNAILRTGLFRSNAGTIKNLTVAGKISSGSVQYIGLLVGINYGPIENCKVYAEVSGTGTYVGAVAGASAGAIKYTEAYGTVAGASAVGGIVGYQFKSGTIGNIENCDNYANVSTQDAAFAQYSGLGGITAVIGSGATILNCTNYGAVEGTTGMNGGTGGIVGNLYATSVEGCTNYGIVSAGQNTGGVVGATRSGNAATVTGCVNHGTVTGAGDYTGGIIGYLANGSSITDCGSAEDSVVTGTRYVGGVIGGAVLGTGTATNTSTVSGLSFSGKVTGSGQSIGGIVGYNTAELSDCHVVGSATIVGVNQVGGIAGYSTGGITSCDTEAGVQVSGGYGVGGIIGYFTGSVTVFECDNYAEVLVTDGGDGYWIGGIVGMNGAGCTVTQCDNYGAITGIGGGSGGVGGIVGDNYGASSIVSECENHGNVAGVYRVGGIAGYNRNAKAEVRDCTNRGTVITSAPAGSTASVGGIVGYNDGAVYDNSNYGGYITANDNVTMVDYIIGQNTTDTVDGNNNYYTENE